MEKEKFKEALLKKEEEIGTKLLIPTIWRIIQKSPRMSQFAAIIQTCYRRQINKNMPSTVLDSLVGAREKTVLVPENGDWFVGLNGKIETAPLENLVNFIKYHIIPNQNVAQLMIKEKSSMIPNALKSYIMACSILTGTENTKKNEDGEEEVHEMEELGVNILFNFMSTVTSANIPGSDGLIHLIDKPCNTFFSNQCLLLPGDQLRSIDISAFLPNAEIQYEIYSKAKKDEIIENSSYHELERKARELDLLSDDEDEIDEYENNPEVKRLMKEHEDEEKRKKLEAKKKNVIQGDLDKLKDFTESELKKEGNKEQQQQQKEEEELEGSDKHILSTIYPGIKDLKGITMMKNILEKYTTVRNDLSESSDMLLLVPPESKLKLFQNRNNDEEKLLDILRGFVLKDFVQEKINDFLADKSTRNLTFTALNGHTIRVYKNKFGNLIFVGKYEHQGKNINYPPVKFSNGYVLLVDSLVL